MEDLKLNYDDVVIIPEVSTDIVSRKTCDWKVRGGMSPIWVSPMDTVINLDNWKVFYDSYVNVVIPRNVDFEIRVNMMVEFSKYKYMSPFIAFSLEETKKIFLTKNKVTDILDGCNDENKRVMRFCIDMANGHMNLQIELIKEIKDKYGDCTEIMGGNVANPQTYKLYDEAGCDYLRVGIGGGAGCFVAGTKVRMADGTEKNIEDVQIGDVVKTLNGSGKVLTKLVKKVYCTVVINDKIECTVNHEFLASRLEQKGFVPTENMDLVTDLYTENGIERVNSIVSKTGDVTVYDIEVEDEHNYIANGYHVHNCTTSSNTGIHFPMFSLIKEMYEMKKSVNGKCAIIADGGIRGFRDVQKALIYADYVMIGSLFNKAIESAGKTTYGNFYWNIRGKKILRPLKTLFYYGREVPKKKYNDVVKLIKDNKLTVWKEFYGMSTKKAQKDILLGNGKEVKNLKTSEGIVTYQKVEYSVNGWMRNEVDYLRSAMSYTNSHNLEEYKESDWVRIDAIKFNK